MSGVDVLDRKGRIVASTCARRGAPYKPTQVQACTRCDLLVVVGGPHRCDTKPAA